MAVANSKGVYHAFALTLSSGGEVLDFDVRHYAERRDYHCRSGSAQRSHSADYECAYVYWGITFKRRRGNQDYNICYFDTLPDSIFERTPAY